MLEMRFLIKGLFLGLSMAAMIGPIALICINRTLRNGRLAGFMIGIGAATGDAIYASIAAFGLTFISNALLEAQMALRLIGGGFLIYLGFKTLLANPHLTEHSPKIKVKGLLREYATTVFLTVTNPTTIISFLALFAGLGLGTGGGTYGNALFLVVGTFLGTATGFAMIVELVNLFRRKLAHSFLRLANKLAGSLLALFGLVILISFVKR